MSKARLVVTAITVEKRRVSEVAKTYGVARSWIYTLLARYEAEGEAAFEPRSRRHRQPRGRPGRPRRPGPLRPGAVVDRVHALERDTLYQKDKSPGQDPIRTKSHGSPPQPRDRRTPAGRTHRRHPRLT